MQDKQSPPNFHAGRCCPEVQLPHVGPGLGSSKAAVPRRVIGKLPRFCGPAFPSFVAIQPNVVIYAGKRQTPASEDGQSTFEVQESMGKVGCSRAVWCSVDCSTAPVGKESHARLVTQCIADVQELSHQQNQDVRGQLARLSAALQSRGALQVDFALLALVQCFRQHQVAEGRQ